MPYSCIGVSPCTKYLEVWGERVRVARLAIYCNYLSKKNISLVNYVNLLFVLKNGAVHYSSKNKVFNSIVL